MENPNYEQVVSEAAKGMDTVKPGWYKHVYRQTLDIHDCNRCLFAQVFGDYMDGILAFRRGLRITPSEYYDRFAGVFASPQTTKLWLAEIDARLEADRAKSADAFIARTTELVNQPKEAEYA